MDEHHLEEALKKAGWSFQWVSWRQENRDWTSFDCVLIRTTWDYIQDRDLFVEKIKAIEASGCPLFNNGKLVEWNSKKTYLQDLSKKGVTIIPTIWTQAKSTEQLWSLAQELSRGQVVIKPLVGAASVSTFSMEPKKPQDFEPVIQELEKREVMIQPFMGKVLEEGEYSAHFFGGEFSHMVLKKPKPKDFRTQPQFGSVVEKREISPHQRAFCESVLEHIPEDWLYARVDFINDDLNKPHLIELEMVEPALYFSYDERSGDRLVQALASRV